MWRIHLFSLSVLVVVMIGATPATAQDSVTDDDMPVLRIHEDDDDDSETIDLRYDGDDSPDIAPGETDDPRDDDDPRPAQTPDFIMGHVDWEFIPIIEVQQTRGAVTAVDAQSTLQADEQGIADCFHATSYPGDGAVEVELYLSYNGVPTSVNGTTDQVLRPTQARCVLRRAWGYEFPRLAEHADQPSRLRYRVSFSGQKVDAPATDPRRPQLLLERVTTPTESLQSPLAEALSAKLSTVEHCAAEGLDEMPTDLIATEVHAQWEHRSDGHYRPADVDITVTNKSSSQLPSSALVDCYQRVLRQWAVEIDPDRFDELPDHLQGAYYITVRPAGWYGL